MEQNSPLITKKIWKLVHVMFFMLKKGIAKRNFLADLNMMISKRGKIAGKALQNLMSHHNHHNANAASPPPPGDYEFSCRNTPPYPLSLFSNHKKYHNKRDYNNAPLAVDDDCNDDMVINTAVLNVLDHMLKNGTPSTQPTITDSPFHVTNSREDNGLVDEAAEKFINRFYNDRRREN